MARKHLMAVLVAGGMLTGGGAAAAAPADTAGAHGVDWQNATFTVPPVGPCPEQTVDFQDGTAETDRDVYRFTPNRAIKYADVGGSHRTDALFLLDCGPHGSEYTTALVAMTTGSDGQPVPLGTVAEPDVWTTVPVDFDTWYGDVMVAIRDQQNTTVRTEYYRWAESAEAFVRVDGR